MGDSVRIQYMGIEKNFLFKPKNVPQSLEFFLIKSNVHFHEIPPVIKIPFR